MLVFRKDDPAYANSFMYAAFKLHRDFVLLQRQIDKTSFGRFLKHNPLGRFLSGAFGLARKIKNSMRGMKMNQHKRTIQRIAIVGRCTEEQAQVLASIGFPQGEANSAQLSWVYYDLQSGIYPTEDARQLTESSATFAAPNFDELYAWLLENHRYTKLKFLCGTLHDGCSIEVDSPRFNKQYIICGKTPLDALIKLATHHPNG